MALELRARVMSGHPGMKEEIHRHTNQRQCMAFPLTLTDRIALRRKEGLAGHVAQIIWWLW